MSMRGKSSKLQYESEEIIRRAPPHLERASGRLIDQEYNFDWILSWTP
jgi:hypothetical protein